MEFRTIAIVAIFLAAAAPIGGAKSATSNDSEQRMKLVDLQRRHVHWLLDHPDVTAVDVNHKSVGGKQTDQLSLVVWVRKKLPESEVPEERRLPREIEGLQVDVIEGEIAMAQVHGFFLVCILDMTCIKHTKYYFLRTGSPTEINWT